MLTGGGEIVRPATGRSGFDMDDPKAQPHPPIDAEGGGRAAAGNPGRPLEQVLRMDEVCDRFEADWGDGGRPRIEAYLDGFDAAGRAALLRELLALELAIRRASGERPGLDDYRTRFPGDDCALVAAFELRGGDPSAATQVDRAARSPGAVARGAGGESGTLHDESPRMSGETVAGPAGRPGPESARWPALDGYEIEAELGRGGMGVVYRARETRLNRAVAVKMILGAETARAEALVRFLAEAETVARLQHPNIIQIHALGDQDGRPFFVMELAGGGSLADRLDGTPRPARDAARLVAILARAIHEAHAIGVVHRDLKPANVLLAADGTPKITDFGLAKILGADSGLTRTEVVMGSPSYMAPEQAEGLAREAGPAADVYALGAIFYELLTGRPPFKGASVLQTLEQVRSVEPVPPTRLQPATPRDAETICLKCLAKAPDRRYPSAEAMAVDLARFLEGKSILARRAGPARRAWLWCRRNPAVAGLAAASALLLLLLAAGSTAAALTLRGQRDELRDAIRRADRAETGRKLEMVDALLATAPDGVPYLLAGLRSARELARPILLRTLNDPAAPAPRRLRAGEALSVLGWPEPWLLMEGIATAPGGECRNLLAALKVSGKPVLAELGRRSAPGAGEAARTRFAITALFLGERWPARGMLAFRPDPADRLGFIRAFPSWHGDLTPLAGLLRREADPAFRSGVCAALAGLDPAAVPAEERAALVPVLLEFSRGEPHAAARAAAELALRRWSVPLPPLHRSFGPVAGRDWYANPVGLTMVELPEGAFYAHQWNEGPQRLAIIRRRWFLADREVSRRAFREFLDDPDVPDSARPRGWQGPDASASPSADGPVNGVDWEEMVLFCNWLSRREGLSPCYGPGPGPAGSVARWTLRDDADGYRVPEMFLFEYAYGGGTYTEFPTGEDTKALADVGVIVEVRAEPGGSRLPNAWGLFDTVGNLWEVCTLTRPDGRVDLMMAGGAYDSGSWDCRTGLNRGFPGARGTGTAGFRVTRALLPKSPDTPPVDDLLVKLGAGLETIPRRRGEAARLKSELTTRRFAEADRAVRGGRWAEAGDQLDALVRLDPRDHWAQWLAAVARLQEGRRSAHKDRSRGLLGRFGGEKEPWYVAERIAKACLLVPADAGVTERAGRIAERARLAMPKVPWTQLVAGLAEYRAGRFEPALERLRVARELVDASDEPISPVVDAMNLVVGSMASSRLGRGRDAENRLARADAILDGAIRRDGPDPRYPNDWYDWSCCEILRDEAAGLILDRGFPADPFAR